MTQLIELVLAILGVLAAFCFLGIGCGLAVGLGVTVCERIEEWHNNDRR